MVFLANIGCHFNDAKYEKAMHIRQEESNIAICLSISHSLFMVVRTPNLHREYVVVDGGTLHYSRMEFGVLLAVFKINVW